MIVSINRILTKSFLDDVHTNTIIFFGISIATVALCCMVFHITRHSVFVRYHVSACKNAEIGDDQRAITQTQCNPEEVSLVSPPFALAKSCMLHISLSRNLEAQIK